MGAGSECDRYNRSLPLRIYGFGKTNPTETELRGDKEVEDGPTGWSHSKVRGRREGSRGKPGDGETGTRGGGEGLRRRASQ